MCASPGDDDPAVLGEAEAGAEGGALEPHAIVRLSTELRPREGA